MKKSIGAQTIVYPTPVFVIGTYDDNKEPNVMTAAWGGICCSDPPCVAVSLRKATYSYGNIIESKAFTVNIPPEQYAREADYFGIASGRRGNKLAAAGLTPVESDLVHAPFIKEFPLVLECALRHTFELGLHTQFVGEILDVKADASVITDGRFPDIEKVKPMIFSPGDRNYYGIGPCIGAAFSIGREILK